VKKKILIAVAALIVVAGGIWGVYTYKEIEKGKKERALTDRAELVTTPVTPTPAPTGSVRTFKLGDKSLIKWTGYKKVGQHSGSFLLFEGVGKMSGENLEKATIDLSIETDSCTVLDDPTGVLEKVMKKDSFFHCEKFPISTFKSVKITKADGPNKYAVTGSLTLRDVTQTIRFPATFTVAGDTVKLDANFLVNRKWWKIIWQAAGDSFLYDDARLELKAEAKETK